MRSVLFLKARRAQYVKTLCVFFYYKMLSHFIILRYQYATGILP